MNLKKLDARFKGYNTFKFVADYNLRQDRPLYLEHRLWMWENFGPSSEFVLHHHLDPSPQWCWDVSEYNIRIYFATDKEANWFKLRWGENV
jgi:hypothetical protein